MITMKEEENELKVFKKKDKKTKNNFSQNVNSCSGNTKSGKSGSYLVASSNSNEDSNEFHRNKSWDQNKNSSNESNNDFYSKLGKNSSDESYEPPAQNNISFLNAPLKRDKSLEIMKKKKFSLKELMKEQNSHHNSNNSDSRSKQNISIVNIDNIVMEQKFKNNKDSTNNSNEKTNFETNKLENDANTNLKNKNKNPNSSDSLTEPDYTPNLNKIKEKEKQLFNDSYNGKNTVDKYFNSFKMFNIEDEDTPFDFSNQENPMFIYNDSEDFNKYKKMNKSMIKFESFYEFLKYKNKLANYEYMEKKRLENSQPLPQAQNLSHINKSQTQIKTNSQPLANVKLEDQNNLN